MPNIEIVISNYDNKYKSTKPAIFRLTEDDYKKLDLTRIKEIIFNDNFNIEREILTQKDEKCDPTSFKDFMYYINCVVISLFKLKLYNIELFRELLYDKFWQLNKYKIFVDKIFESTSDEEIIKYLLIFIYIYIYSTIFSYYRNLIKTILQSLLTISGLELIPECNTLIYELEEFTPPLQLYNEKCEKQELTIIYEIINNQCQHLLDQTILLTRLIVVIKKNIVMHTNLTLEFSNYTQDDYIQKSIKDIITEFFKEFDEFKDEFLLNMTNNNRTSSKFNYFINEINLIFIFIFKLYIYNRPGFNELINSDEWMIDKEYSFFRNNLLENTITDDNFIADLLLYIYLYIYHIIHVNYKNLIISIIESIMKVCGKYSSPKISYSVMGLKKGNNLYVYDSDCKEHTYNKSMNDPRFGIILTNIIPKQIKHLSSQIADFYTSQTADGSSRTTADSSRTTADGSLVRYEPRVGLYNLERCVF